MPRAAIPNALVGKPPRTYTPEEQETIIAYFAKMALRELRKRQDLVKWQIQQAHEMRHDAVLEDLQMIQRLLSAAVDRREFPGE